METVEQLAASIETTGDIQSIVRTMKSLSAVSIRQYERAIDALEDYRRTIDLGLQVVLAGHVRRPAADKAVPARAVVIVIGSDRGLCGRFNEAIAAHAARRLHALQGKATKPPLVLVLGLRAAARLETLGFTPDETRVLPGSVGGLGRTAQAILIQLDRWRTRETVGRIDVVFNRRTADARAKPGAHTLVPLSAAYLRELAARPWPSRRLPITMADPDALFSHLVRQHLFIDLYRAGAQSLASEHASRLAAMQAAERNINDRLQDLTARYRSRRQETITNELLDIVAGFEAMRDKSEVSQQPA